MLFLMGDNSFILFIKQVVIWSDVKITKRLTHTMLKLDFFLINKQ